MGVTISPRASRTFGRAHTRADPPITHTRGLHQGWRRASSALCRSCSLRWCRRSVCAGDAGTYVGQHPPLRALAGDHRLPLLGRLKGDFILVLRLHTISVRVARYRSYACSSMAPWRRGCAAFGRQRSPLENALFPSCEWHVSPSASRTRFSLLTRIGQQAPVSWTRRCSSCAAYRTSCRPTRAASCVASACRTAHGLPTRPSSRRPPTTAPPPRCTSSAPSARRSCSFTSMSLPLPAERPAPAPAPAAAASDEASSAAAAAAAAAP